MAIYYIDRKTGQKKKEDVAGEKYLNWIYENKVGITLLETVVKKKLFSTLYGKLQDYSFSKRKIISFVEDFQLDMNEAQRKDINSYTNFNDFFTRKLTREARPISLNKDNLISPADGRLFAYENIDINKMFQIKGSYYKLNDLLQDDTLANIYKNGTCVVVRLAPIDYHRFHFPDSGVSSDTKKIDGLYYSVNPISLQKVVEIYCQNKREFTKFKSDNFDDIILIEVGATCVGSIIQTYTPNTPINKGDEKGYFKFGGSTVIMLFKENVVTIDDDIIQNTISGFETKVNMGEIIGKKK